MSETFAAAEALLNYRKNQFNKWNVSKSSSVLGTDPTNASNRVYSGFADIRVPKGSKRFTRSDKVFAMGSCFAREIERALVDSGLEVVSVDRALINRPEFIDINGRTRDGFFHRFTPRSMWQEFKRSFDELENWSDDCLIFQSRGQFFDANYWAIPGFDYSPAAIAARRSVARHLVRRVSEARVIVLTLGFIEAWRHRPTGLWLNYVDPAVLHRRSEEFEFCLLDVDEVLLCLEEILEMIRRHHNTKDHPLFLTVSPVPLGSTFTQSDIVVANTNSKATLRAAAGVFSSRHPDVTYYPSYEMVVHSHPEVAWRPDRLHVNGDMVRHVVSTFQEAFFDLHGGESVQPTMADAALT